MYHLISLSFLTRVEKLRDREILHALMLTLISDMELSVETIPVLEKCIKEMKKGILYKYEEWSDLRQSNREGEVDASRCPHSTMRGFSLQQPLQEQISVTTPWSLRS